MDYFDDSDSSVEIRYTRRRIRRISSSDDSEVDQCGVSGVTVNTQNLSRREVFELFFNEELVRKIISETNKYGATNADFVPVTDDELKIFIALNILMSLVPKPTIQSYWTKDKSIETPYFKNVIPRNRFISIATNLHFSSNDISNDPLIKIQEVSEIIRKNFIRMYVPNKNISIDESLIRCRSCLRYIQFIKTKRARFGTKFHKLCDSKTRYIHNFKIYVGKDKTNTGSASRNVVINLLKESRLLYKGYCLFIDYWYSSPSLYRELYNMRTNVCGTARMNRKEMPRELKLLQLEKGEAVVFSTTDMAAIKWKDKKDVVLLTTMHNLDFVETEKTNLYTGQKSFKPTVVIDYDKNMGGVDVGDQMLSKFHTMRRCKKAYKNIFFYFIDMMLLNSYIIFKNNKKDRAFHVYKQKLAEEIVEKYFANVRIREVSSINDSLTRYTGRHFPIRIPPTLARGNKTSKRCVVCLSMLLRKETVFKCDVCNVALCIDHFKKYHVK
ncbi:PREDICTED: piggyBac transposable element-derived protein 4-like isoform X2 [Dinoponera quadriceps]|uniref:PiggyBac transposable element-derived protein 4-like isoform X2 n=1 Tax=Dinoponera quadriceps TaxID=609295 RepID=A0A6P3YA38_DINQU|nr:PREDICTED: piggyBac transposable element-derived protein 4-like isoform X2 [Dinoponera quadriceps]